MTIDSNSGISEAMLESWHLTEILSVDLADTTGWPASVFGSIDGFVNYFNLDRDEVLRQLLAFAGLGKIGDLAFGFNNLCSTAKLQKLKDLTPEELQRKYLPNILSLGASSIGDDLPFAAVLTSEKGPGAPTSWHTAIAKLRSKTFGEKTVDCDSPAGADLFVGAADAEVITHTEDLKRKFSPDGLDWPITQSCIGPRVVMQGSHWLPNPTQPISAQVKDVDISGLYSETIPSTQEPLGRSENNSAFNRYSETIDDTQQPLGLNFGSEADVTLKEAPPTEEDYNVLDLRSVTDDEPES